MCYSKIHAFFISNTFVSNTRQKSVKNRAKAKQHAEVELLLLVNYVVSSSTYHPKIVGDILKKCAKNKFVYLNEVI